MMENKLKFHKKVQEFRDKKELDLLEMYKNRLKNVHSAQQKVKCLKAQSQKNLSRKKNEIFLKKKIISNLSKIEFDERQSRRYHFLVDSLKRNYSQAKIIKLEEKKVKIKSISARKKKIETVQERLKMQLESQDQNIKLAKRQSINLTRQEKKIKKQISDFSKIYDSTKNRFSKAFFTKQKLKNLNSNNKTDIGAFKIEVEYLNSKKFIKNSEEKNLIQENQPVHNCITSFRDLNNTSLSPRRLTTVRSNKSTSKNVFSLRKHKRVREL